MRGTARSLSYLLGGSILSLGWVQESQAQDFLARYKNCHRYYSSFLKKSVEYCLDRSHPELPQSASEPVVYYMHGAFKGASQWYNDEYAPALRDISEMEPVPAFTVVSFNTSSMSFFTDEGDIHTGNQAFETWFFTEFRGFVEKKYGLCAQRDCRGVIGSSMGGFGALKTILRHPDDFWFAGANFAAVLPVNIYDWTIPQWRDYFAGKKIGADIGEIFIKELRKLFPTPALYDAHDPVKLVENWKNDAAFPPMYFNVGGEDQFGFNDGFERFKGALEKRGLPFESYYDPLGDHLGNEGGFGKLLVQWTAKTIAEKQKAAGH